MKKYAVIVPVREFGNTKIRLRGALTVAQRAELTKAFLHRMIWQIDRSEALSALIIASSPKEVKKIIPKSSKVRVLSESRIHGGVNSAFQDGLKKIENASSMDSVILIPSDLPFLTFRALDRISYFLEMYDLLINPSRRLDGTSLLAFNLEKGKIPLHYDDNSFKNHSAEAKKMKIKHRVLKMKEFSFDVDSPEDLDVVKKMLHANSVEDLLVKLVSGVMT